MENRIFDCIIIGGGLAGLSLSVLLAQKKYSVLLVEKKSYPYHKVCGEYISNESRDFLLRLGIPLDNLNLPQIHKVLITDVQNHTVSEEMELGGFGISRYTLDKLLCDKASELGVNVLENTTCSKYEKENSIYQVITSTGNFKSKILVAGFGRYAFGNFHKAKKVSENWIGVKYHIRYDFPEDKIALHTFKHGYCGISKIEDNRYCLCYLVKASLLNSYQNKVQALEKDELYKNHFLKEIFTKAEFLFEKPLTISNITFDIKEPVFEDVFYIGDSAGSIAPLTGNGMSNAMRSTWILSAELDTYFSQKISFGELREKYKSEWNKAFKKRINKGRIIQHFFCNPALTSFFIRLMKKSKWLRQFIVRQTHGSRF